MAIHDYHDHGDMGNYEAWKAEEELRKEKEEREKEQTKVRNNQQPRQAQGDKMQLPTEKMDKRKWFCN